MCVGASCETTGKKKPETILYYNVNKCGVDMLDSMCRQLTTKASCRRWPLAVFFNVLDMAGINAWIIYKKKTGSTISRRRFLHKMAEELMGVDDVMLQPLQDDPLLPLAKRPKLQKRVVCAVRSNCIRNNTSTECSLCKKIACGWSMYG